jgi:hypothetical protein
MTQLRLLFICVLAIAGMIVLPALAQDQVILDRSVLQASEPVKIAMLYHVLAEKETPIEQWAVKDPYLNDMADDFEFGKKLLAREKVKDLRRIKAQMVAGENRSIRLRRPNLRWREGRNDDARVYARELSDNNSFVVPHQGKKYLIHLNQEGIDRDLRFNRSSQYKFFNQLERDRADAFLKIEAVSAEPEPVEVKDTEYYKINARLAGMTIYSADNKTIIYQVGDDRSD